MSSIHQTVRAGRTQQIGTFQQLKMGIACGDAPANRLAN
jgi:hypothetical protein